MHHFLFIDCWNLLFKEVNKLLRRLNFYCREEHKHFFNVTRYCLNLNNYYTARITKDSNIAHLITNFAEYKKEKKFFLQVLWSFFVTLRDKTFALILSMNKLKQNNFFSFFSPAKISATKQKKSLLVWIPPESRYYTGSGFFINSEVIVKIQRLIYWLY